MSGAAPDSLLLLRRQKLSAQRRPERLALGIVGLLNGKRRAAQRFAVDRRSLRGRDQLEVFGRAQSCSDIGVAGGFNANQRDGANDNADGDKS